MSVMLSDRAVKAAERLVDARVQEMDGDRILAIALGEIRDEEFEAMRTLRHALRDAGSAKAPRRNSDARSVAIGRHAFEYLTSQDSLEKRAREVIRAAKPRRTLVGLAVPDGETAKLISTVLRDGADSSEDQLERSRLASAADRVGQLVRK